MKTTISKTICAIIIALFTVQFNSSAQTWQMGGNPDYVPFALGLLNAPTNNYYGGTQTASLQFGTGGNTYMFIGGSIIPANSNNSNVNFTLFDIQGNEVKMRLNKSNNYYIIYRDGLQTGMYIISIEFNNQIIHKKLIITN